MSEEISFTQDQVNEQLEQAKTQWETEFLNPITTERDELLKFKPKDLSDEEKAIQVKQNELWVKEKSLDLKSVELEKFADFFNAQNSEELKGQIETFQGLINELKVSWGYVPTDHSRDDEYTVHEKKKDTQGMIASKFSKLFN